MDERQKLEMDITEYILEVADLKPKVTRSDLQGMAQAKAKKIINEVEEVL